MDKTSKNRNGRFWNTIILCAAGLLLNLTFSNIVKALKVPIFLDNIGTVLVAALAGYLPGMFIGFLTNVLNSFSDPISLYYGILSVLIAVCASLFSKKGMLRKPLGCLKAALCFAFIGGAIGSCMTWLLYGGGIGEGISAPFAHRLYAEGWPMFWAQFAADAAIDLADKIIAMLPVYLFLHFYPKRLYGKFSLSYLYEQGGTQLSQDRERQPNQYRLISLNSRVLGLIVVATLLVSIASTIIGTCYYSDKLIERYGEKVQSTAALAAAYVDAGRVDDYIRNGRKAEGYAETENNLYRIYHSGKGLAFVYVYRFRPEGNYVVFDLAVPTGPNDEPGSLIAFDKTLNAYKSRLLAGDNMDGPLFSHDQYGWLCTACCPIRDGQGRTQAYACVDISLAQYKYDLLTYIIRNIALLFGTTMLIAAYSMWYARSKFVEPINTIVMQSRALDAISPDLWLKSDVWRDRQKVKTGDEIEELYNTVCQLEENAANNIAAMKETERQLRESKEIERKNQELAAAVKRADDANAAKTLFLSNISHDMRTPLNSIIGFTALARESGDLAEKNSCLERISQASGYLLGLINDTLDLSRMETGKVKLVLRTFDGGQIIKNVLDCNGPAAAAKHIHLAVGDDGLAGRSLFGDDMRIEEIINNIVANAIKFTPEDGQVEVRALPLLETADRIKFQFSIKDNGVGMSSGFLPHAFEPFTQENPYENRNFTGSGLGLSIVKKLVDIMNGSIAVESTPGKGTLFTVVIDIQKAQGGAGDVSAEPADFSLLRNRRILLCEDHPMNIELAKLLLEKAGMQVETATDGQIGLDTYRQFGAGHFDAVLMDIRMPNMDGLEAARQIRGAGLADSARLPIIAMTANAYDEDREKAREAGMNAHLTKPIDPKQMYCCLAEEINKARQK